MKPRSCASRSGALERAAHLHLIRPVKNTAKKIVAQAGPFLGLLVVIALFSIPSETREFFLTYHNFKTIFTQTVIVAIGALGMTIIIVSGGIDLSVGSSIAFTSVVGALTIQQGWGTVPTVLTVIRAGGFIGCLNGAVIAARRLAPFIITPGTLSIIRGSGKGGASNQTI